MIETLATCFCKRMLFCYLTDEKEKRKRYCLYTADFLVGLSKIRRKVENTVKTQAQF